MYCYYNNHVKVILFNKTTKTNSNTDFEDVILTANVAKNWIKWQ